jgi:hypothetical protein
MKANELRIGNYLNTINGVKRVSDISIDRYCWFTDNQCEPIQLTEEWLVKFGFEKELDRVYRKNKSHMIEFIFYEEGVLCTSQSVCLNKIKHIHQLQNLYFALTGEELVL